MATSDEESFLEHYPNSYRTRNRIKQFQQTITAKDRKDAGTSGKDNSFDNLKLSLDSIKFSNSSEISRNNTCSYCGKSFKNVKSHISKKHRLEADKVNNSLQNINQFKDIEQSKVCSICNQKFKNDTGVKIHIQKSHPEVYRKSILDKTSKNVHKVFVDNKNPKEDISNNTLSDTDNKIKKFDNDVMQWKIKFEEIEFTNEEEFSNCVESFSEFLVKSMDILPGPKHPAKRYYEARKRAGFNRSNDLIVSSNSNRQRASKRKKEKRRAEYEYQLTQYYFYNQRRKAVRKVFENKKNTICRVELPDIYDYFKSKFENSNDLCCNNGYKSTLTSEEKSDLDNTHNSLITTEEINNTIKLIAVDTAPGPDRIIMRLIKSNPKIAEILSKIGTTMIKTGLVPRSFRQARTILIHKKGAENDLNNWRPISICSVLRRIIEKVIDRQIRKYVVINENQRGFMHMPGCHINNSIIENILIQTKCSKGDVSLIFLDIEKAYDSIGHQHLKKIIDSSNIPTKLKEIIINLQVNNESYIDLGFKRTKTFKIRKGVFQGAPLSPIIFNLCINHIFNELSEPAVKLQYGYNLSNGQSIHPVSILGYADDTVIIGKDKDSAIQLLIMVENRFNEIGLKVNAKKSTAIIIRSGTLIMDYFHTIKSNEQIVSIDKDQKIKYLGVSYNDSLIFDHQQLLKDFANRLETLTKSYLLDCDQKLNILSQYIAPVLVYPLQMAPLNKIPKSFLEDLDKIIRSNVKETLQIPGDSPNSFLYSSKSVKGLEIFNASWEAYLQQFNKFTLLQNSKCKFIKNNFDDEKSKCINKLNLDDSNISSTQNKKVTSKCLRKLLRDKEYDQWCRLPQKGKGVILYQEVKSANRWLYNRGGLSSSEWRDCLKLTCNVAAVRTLPGRRTNTSRCRHCNEFESLAHVLGYCGFGETLRIRRHNEVRKLIADAMREKGLEVHEEVHGLSENDST